MVPNVLCRASNQTTAASTRRKNTSAPVRIWSCRPLDSLPSSGSFPESSLDSSLVAMMSLAEVTELSQELAVARDDRQIDELRARVVLGGIGDVEAAEIDIHLFHGVDEFFAVEVAPGALQALDQHLRAEEAFQRAEIDLLQAGLLCRDLVLLDHRHRGAPGEGHHLRNGHAHAVLAERVGQRLAADEGHVVERGTAAELLHLP